MNSDLGKPITDMLRKKDAECRKGHRSFWRVIQRECNFSAFSGYHRTPSDYSGITCTKPGCSRYWRTKAAYVSDLPDYDPKESTP
jgi:hypothetical protein